MQNNSVWVDHNSLFLERKVEDLHDTWTLVRKFNADFGEEEARAVKRELQQAEPGSEYRLIKLSAVELLDEITIPIAELVGNYNTLGPREIDIRPKSYLGKFSFSR